MPRLLGPFAPASPPGRDCHMEESMRTLPLVASASLALAVSTPLIAQQGPVVTPAEIDTALEAHDGRIASEDRKSVV